MTQRFVLGKIYRNKPMPRRKGAKEGNCAGPTQSSKRGTGTGRTPRPHQKDCEPKGNDRRPLRSADAPSSIHGNGKPMNMRNYEEPQEGQQSIQDSHGTRRVPHPQASLGKLKVHVHQPSRGLRVPIPTCRRYECGLGKLGPCPTLYTALSKTKT